MHKIAFAPAAVLLLHILATAMGWYTALWWLDTPMHFLGGAAIAASSYYFLEDFSRRQKFHAQFKPLQILILIALTALAAVAWEFFEYALDATVRTAMQASVNDTMKDMAMGLLGAILAAGAIVLRKE